MKKIIVFVFAMFLSLNALAQLEVKPNSFKLVEGFVNINLEKQNDSYEKPYAVLKIRTENIDDKQRNELIFKVQDNVDYEVEYSFDDLYGTAGENLLRFDFAIKNKDELICLIECQGEQHFAPVQEFGGERQFHKQVENDRLKREYFPSKDFK